MNELVKIQSDDVFTDTKVIADGTGNEHKSVNRLVTKYREDFEDFGEVKFSDFKSLNPEGGRPTRIYMLNEPQATLLITYLDNTAVVRKFKKELVRQFYAMRTELNRRHTERAQLKPIRREMTDVIQQVDNDKWAYKKYTDLAYKAVTGMNARKLREERGASKDAAAVDYMTADEIHAVAEMQYRIAVLLDIGMDYQQVKAALSNRLTLIHAA